MTKAMRMLIFRFHWHQIFNINFPPLRFFFSGLMPTWFVVLFQLSLTVMPIRVVLGWLGWPGAGRVALPIISFVLLVILVWCYADLESLAARQQGHEILRAALA